MYVSVTGATDSNHRSNKSTMKQRLDVFRMYFFTYFFQQEKQMVDYFRLSFFTHLTFFVISQLDK